MANMKSKLPTIINSFICPYRYFTKEQKEKEMFLTFSKDAEVLNDWKKGKKCPWKSKYLLNYLSEKYGGIDNFKLVWTIDSGFKYYIDDTTNIPTVYVDEGEYSAYAGIIKKRIDKLKITKIIIEINRKFSNAIPVNFFNNKPAEDLFDEIKRSEFEMIESLLKNFDKLEAKEQKILMDAVENSPVSTKILDKFKKLGVKSPEKQAKLFLKSVDKLKPKKFEEILRKLISSKGSLKAFEQIGKLSRKDQMKIVKNADRNLLLVKRYEELKKSIKEFEKLILKRRKSDRKDEAEIHKFLLENYWLLGVEYFNKPIKSSIDKSGKKVSDSRIKGRRLYPDFTIDRLDGTKDCIHIEIEEANDPIILKNGRVSQRVMDGINQAITYVVFERLNGKYPKGIAVIGSTGKVGKKSLDKLKILASTIPNVEILTYEDVIKRSKNILKFFEKQDIIKETKID